jgi:hypothetical protein
VLLVLVLVLIASGLAALTIVFSVLVLDTPLTHEQGMRISKTLNVVWVSFWLFQIPIVWLILRRLWAYRSLLQIPISLIVSVLCSFGVGLLLARIAQPEWYSIAGHFK